MWDATLIAAYFMGDICRIATRRHVMIVYRNVITTMAHSKICFLVVGTHRLCCDLGSFIKGQADLVGFPSAVYVDLCERIDDILREKDRLEYDFVVLTVDAQKSSSVKEVKESLGYLEKQLLVGHVCVVNLLSSGPARGVDCEDIVNLWTNYGLPIVRGNVSDKEGCMKLAKRVLILASGVLGLESAVPMVV